MQPAGRMGHEKKQTLQHYKRHQHSPPRFHSSQAGEMMAEIGKISGAMTSAAGDEIRRGILLSLPLSLSLLYPGILTVSDSGRAIMSHVPIR